MICSLGGSGDGAAAKEAPKGKPLGASGEVKSKKEGQHVLSPVLPSCVTWCHMKVTVCWTSAISLHVWGSHFLKHWYHRVERPKGPLLTTLSLYNRQNGRCVYIFILEHIYWTVLLPPSTGIRILAEPKANWDASSSPSMSARRGQEITCSGGGNTLLSFPSGLTAGWSWTWGLEGASGAGGPSHETDLLLSEGTEGPVTLRKLSGPWLQSRKPGGQELYLWPLPKPLGSHPMVLNEKC